MPLIVHDLNFLKTAKLFRFLQKSSLCLVSLFTSQPLLVSQNINTVPLEERLITCYRLKEMTKANGRQQFDVHCSTQMRYGTTFNSSAEKKRVPLEESIIQEPFNSQKRIKVFYRICLYILQDTSIVKKSAQWKTGPHMCLCKSYVLLQKT